MPDQRSTTTLDLKVNARQLGDLEKKLRKAFGSETPRAFNTAIGQVNKALEENAKRIGQISTSMGKVKQGTEAFTRLQKELRDATKEARALDQAMGQLTRSQQNLSQRAGGVAGGGRGAGPGGGGPSALGRLAGFQLGMPGMAGMATAMSAIPIAGVMGAGAMMAAAGTYSSRLRYEQARMQAAPFLMPSAEATAFQRRQISGPTAARVVGGEEGETFEQVRARAIEKLTPGMLETIAEGLFRPDEKGAGAQGFRQMLMDRVRKVQGARAERIESGEMTAVDRLAVGIVGKMAGFAETFGGNQGMQQVYARTLGRQVIPGRGARFNQAFDAQSYVQQGIQFGINPAEALQQAAGLGRAAGRPMGDQDFGIALALQRTTGVGLEQQGGMVRGLRRTGGEGSMQEVADAIGLAVASGLEGSEIGEELQKQSGFLQQQASQGIRVNFAQMQGTQVGLQNAGIEAFRAGDITRQFAQGGANVGFTGPQRAVDLRLMRSMGYTGHGGPEEYAKFRLKMQQPGEVAKAMPAYLQQFQAPGMGDNMRTLMIQQALSQFGARVGPDEAQKLMELQKAGAFEGGVDLEKLKQAGIDLTSVTGGNLKAEAAIENERIAIGAKMAESMQNLSRMTNDLAASFENIGGPILQRVTDNMEHFSTALESGTAALGASIYGESLSPR